VQKPLRAHTPGEPPGGWRGAQPPLAGCGPLRWTADTRLLADQRLRLCLHGVIGDAAPAPPLIDSSSPNTHPSSQPTPNWMCAVPADQLPDQDRSQDHGMPLLPQ
jgi:hypothetical protein